MKLCTAAVCGYAGWWGGGVVPYVRAPALWCGRPKAFVVTYCRDRIILFWICSGARGTPGPCGTHVLF